MILEMTLYMLISFALFIGSGFILWQMKIDRYVMIAFVMQSLVLVTIALVETMIVDVLNDTLYSMFLWFFTFGMFQLMMVILYFAHINISQPKPPPGVSYRKRFIKETLYFAFIVYGTTWFVGIWFTDFGYFLIKGLEYFNPVDAYWIPYWIGGVFPAVYLQSIVGMILMIVGFRHFFKIRNNAQLKLDSTPQDSTH